MRAVNAAAMRPGFSDPVQQSQLAFRAAMDAFARPGMVITFDCKLPAPDPLSPTLAALGLALLDFETTYWLSPSFDRHAAIGEYLRFHTGAARVDNPALSSFAFVDLTAGDDLDLASFSQGTDEYPDRSTTILAACEHVDATTGLNVSGPGVPGFRSFGVSPLGRDFLGCWATNRAAFPLGVDILFVARSAMVGLPRSQRMLAGG